MKHRILYDSPTLGLEYDAMADYLHALWGRDQTSSSIAAGYERILEWLSREHCHWLLDNHAAIHGYWADLAEWVSLDWYLRARRAGLENHAVVFSTDFLSRRSTEEAGRGMVGGTVAGFGDLGMAREMLLSKSPLTLPSF